MVNLLQRILYSPFNAQLVVTRRCNLSCGYCNEHNNNSSPVPFNILKQRICKLKELGAFSLTFTGGEPFLHPDIFDILSYSKDKFIARIVITNAYLLDEKKVKKLNNSMLTIMQISIDSANPNKTTVKALLPLKKKLEMIAKNAKFRVHLNSVFGSSDTEEVKKVLLFAKKNNMTSTIQLLHDENGKICIDEKKRKEYRIIKNTARWPFFYDRLINIDELASKGESYFKCRTGSRFLYIDEFGDAHWCSQTKNRFSKSLAKYNYYDLKEQFHKRKGCELKCTLGCGRSNSSLDAYRSYR